jgi:hypothetical protein
MNKARVLILVCLAILITGCIGGGGGNEPVEKKDIQNVTPQNLTQTSNGSVQVNDIEIQVTDMGGFEPVHIVSESGTIVSLNREGDTIQGKRGTSYYAIGENSTGYYIIDSVTIEKMSITDPPGTENDTKNNDTDENNDFLNYNSRSAWVVVNPENPSNYNSIQNAINDVNNFFTIIVREGDYNGFDVNKAIDIIAIEQANITKSEFSTRTSGIYINSSNAYSSVNGFNIGQEFKSGIEIETKSLTKIKNTEISGNTFGIDARNTEDRWKLNNVIVKDTLTGLMASDSIGYPVIKNSRFTDNKYGITIRNSNVRQEDINNIDVSGNDQRGIRATSKEGIDVGRYYSNRSERYTIGVSSVYQRCENNTCSGRISEDPEPEKDLEYYKNQNPPRYDLVTPQKSLQTSIDNYQKGDVLIVQGSHSGTYTINNDAQITGRSAESTLSNSQKQACIEIKGDSEPIITSIKLQDCGVNAKGSTGSWALTNILLEGSSSYGVFVTSTQGNWILEDSLIRDKTHGVWVSRSSGNYVVGESYIINNEVGIRGDTIIPRSNPSVKYNKIYNNDNDVESRGNNPIELMKNWWGGDGVQAPQTHTKQTSFKCNNKDCSEIKQNNPSEGYTLRWENR